MKYRKLSPEQTHHQAIIDSLPIIERLRTASQRLALGSLALATTLGYAGHGYQARLASIYDYSADNDSAAPGLGRASAGDLALIEDNDKQQLRVASWNMHQETNQRIEQIAQLLEEEKLDALVLQEVLASDAETLAASLPGYQVSFAVAEVLNKGQDYGNVNITKMPPHEITAIKLAGTSIPETVGNLITGLPQDIYNQLFVDSDDYRPWGNINTSWQENRTAQRSTIISDLGGQAIEVAITGTHLSHISDSPVHARQLKQLAEFAKTTPEDGIAVICGDFNTMNHTAIDQLFPNYYRPVTGPSTDYFDQPIDLCLTNADPDKYTVSARVLDQYATDHYAINMNISRTNID